MVKEEQAKLRKEQNNVIKKINDKWLELQEDFYICYSVKELAYKVAYDILTEYYGDYSGYMQIYYRFYSIYETIDCESKLSEETNFIIL